MLPAQGPIVCPPLPTCHHLSAVGEDPDLSPAVERLRLDEVQNHEGRVAAQREAARAPIEEEEPALAAPRSGGHGGVIVSQGLLQPPEEDKHVRAVGVRGPVVGGHGGGLGEVLEGPVPLTLALLHETKLHEAHGLLGGFARARRSSARSASPPGQQRGQREEGHGPAEDGFAARKSCWF